MTEGLCVLTKRKILIIEKASELFAEHGFDATSVQDITDACGISKGAFYLSFKSKESLLFSIFEYFSSKLIEKMSGLYDLNVGIRERFTLFFSIQFEEIARYSDFILMQMREQTNPVNEEMLELVNDLRGKTYDMQENFLLDMYGEKVRAHMPDLLVLLGGMIKGYIEIIIFNKDLLDYKGLAKYIVERTDSIVNGLTEPFLKPYQLIGYTTLENETEITLETLLKEIEALKLQIRDEEVIISLEIIEQELTLEKIRKPVIRGMMSNLIGNPLTKVLLIKLKKFLESVNV